MLLDLLGYCRYCGATEPHIPHITNPSGEYKTYCKGKQGQVSDETLVLIHTKGEVHITQAGLNLTWTVLEYETVKVNEKVLTLV